MWNIVLPCLKQIASPWGWEARGAARSHPWSSDAHSYAVFRLPAHLPPDKLNKPQTAPGSVFLGLGLAACHFSKSLQTPYFQSGHPGLSQSWSISCHVCLATYTLLSCSPGHPGLSTSPTRPSQSVLSFLALLDAKETLGPGTFFYYNIVDLHYCVSSCCTAKWLSDIYLYILFLIFFSIVVYHSILNMVLCAVE